VRQANYSSLRAELVEFRRRIGQLQHGVIVHQLCRPVWARWMDPAVLSGALDLPGFAAAPGRFRPVQWIPSRWDWVDPLKDIQAQVLAMEAGITSRRKVVEATGYDIEKVDRENAADAARAADLGQVMKKGLSTESIDGKPLEWAHRRMPARPEARRILKLISEAALVDDSTLSVKPPNYLQQQLRDVIAPMQRRRAMELIAIGIGHDATRCSPARRHHHRRRAAGECDDRTVGRLGRK
jgi:hypothetical protein